MGDQRLSDADIGDILDNYLLQQNGNKRSPSPFDPSEALFGADAFPALPSLWPHDNVDLQPPPERPQPHAAPLHAIRTVTPAAQTAPLPTSLHANTFTDVLASVAAQWSPPNEDHLGASAWAAQHELHAAASGIKVEDSGSAHGGQVFYATQLSRMQSGGAPSASGSPQDILLSGAVMDALPDGSGAMSGSEGSAKGSVPRRNSGGGGGGGGGGGRAKESQADRLQHRKARKREKDKIEELQASVSAVMAENAALADQNTATEGELQTHVEELRRLRAAEESALTALADEELAARFNGDVTLTVRDEAVTVLSPEQIKAMTEDDMAHWWNLYIDKLTGLLAAADARPAGPLPDTARRIQALQREALFLHIRAAITNMASVKRFLARGKVEGPFSREGAPDIHGMVARWRSVAEGLQLSGEQRRGVASLWRNFDGRLGRILGARRSMHGAITSTMPNGIMGRDFAVNFLKAHEGMDALKFNLRQEHVVICDFVSTFHQTLTPVQNARFIVSSYPFFPDTVAVSLWIAALDQDAEALGRLRAAGAL